MLANTTALADRLRSLECDICGNGTSNHQLAVFPEGIDANPTKDVSDEIGVACHVITAKSQLHFGSYAMTIRGLLPGDFPRGRHRLSCFHNREGA